MSRLQWTPDPVVNLPENTVFVFGSNEAGLHLGGAAKYAYEKCGAEMGGGFGLCGWSFAIPTLDRNLNRLPLGTIEAYIQGFVREVQNHSGYDFWLTPIGCGIAGFRPQDIAPLFLDLWIHEPANLLWPESFAKYLEAMP